MVSVSRMKRLERLFQPSSIPLPSSRSRGFPVKSSFAASSSHSLDTEVCGWTSQEMGSHSSLHPPPRVTKGGRKQVQV